MPRVKFKDRAMIAKNRTFKLSDYTDFRLRYVAKRHSRSQANMLTYLVDLEYQKVKKAEKLT